MAAASRIVEGEVLRIGEKDFVPIVRVTEVRFRPPGGRVGAGGGFMTARPVAVIDRLGGQERRIQIHDVTAQAIRALAISAAVVWAVSWVMRRRVSHVR